MEVYALWENCNFNVMEEKDLPEPDQAFIRGYVAGMARERGRSNEKTDEILKLLREIRENQKSIKMDQSFILPKSDPTKRKG